MMSPRNGSFGTVRNYANCVNGTTKNSFSFCPRVTPGKRPDFLLSAFLGPILASSPLNRKRQRLGGFPEVLSSSTLEKSIHTKK